MPYAAETKAIWWEKCSELAHGFNKILLIGPVGSGKTMLVRIMATINGKSYCSTGNNRMCIKRKIILQSLKYPLGNRHSDNIIYYIDVLRLAFHD